MAMNCGRFAPEPMRDVISLLSTWTRPEMTVPWLVEDARRRGWVVSEVPAAGGRMTISAGWPGPEDDILVAVGGRESVTGFVAQCRPTVGQSGIVALSAVGTHLWGQPSQSNARHVVWAMPDASCEMQSEDGLVTVTWVTGNDEDPPRGGAAFDMMIAAAGMDDQWPAAVRAAQAILPRGRAQGLLLEMTALFVQTIARQRGISAAAVPPHEVWESLDRLSAGIGNPPDPAAGHGR